MHPEALFNYNELMQQMLATNASYLMISVSIVLALFVLTAAINYVFSVRPFRKEIAEAKAATEKQNETLNGLLEENKKLITNQEERSIEMDNAYKELRQQIETLIAETKSETKDLISKLQTEIAQSKRVQDDYEMKLNDLMIEYHKSKGQVGAMQYYIAQMKKYRKLDWQSFLDSHLSEMIQYVNEEGIAEYYVDDLVKEINLIKGYEKKKAELLTAVKSQTFTPGKDKTED